MNFTIDKNLMVFWVVGCLFFQILPTLFCVVTGHPNTWFLALMWPFSVLLLSVMYMFFDWLGVYDEQKILDRLEPIAVIVEIILLVFLTWLLFNHEKLRDNFRDGLTLMICAFTVIFGILFGTTSKSN